MFEASLGYQVFFLLFFILSFLRQGFSGIALSHVFCDVHDKMGIPGLFGETSKE